jgi:hypothetical protein
MFSEFLPYLGSLWCEVSGQECCVSYKFDVSCYKRLNTCLFCNGIGTRADGTVRNNHAMNMSLCHGGVLESTSACVSRGASVCAASVRVAPLSSLGVSVSLFRRSRWSFGARTMSGACAGMLCTHLMGLIES